MGAAELEILVPMIFATILTLTIAGVILLKPMANKLGALLEAMAQEKANPPKLDTQLDRIHDILESMNHRLALMEERQDFTDALLADPERQRARLNRGSEESGTE